MSDAEQEREQLDQLAEMNLKPGALTIEEMGVRARRNRDTSLDEILAAGEIRPGARTIKALRDRRRVIE